VLFAAAALQQVGLVDTAAGKTAFITGLYIVLVPILGLAVKQRIGKNAWLGAAIAVAGLYFLCVTSSFTVSAYDLLILGGAFFFAVHILLIDYYAQRVDLIKLAFGQNLTCAAVSLLLAALTESVSMASLRQALIPILYCGILSVGVAYTLQIIGQRDTNPASAALILSSETLFALLGGFLLLDERLDGRGALGILLMLAGIICSQLPARFAGSRQTESKTRKVQAEQLEKI